MTLFNQILEAVKLGLVQGLHYVFVLSVVILAIGLIALFFLPEIELRGKTRSRPRTAEQPPAQPTAAH